MRAAVIDFGGFLGVGEKKVAVDWGQLNISGDRIVVGMTKDQAKAAPEVRRDQVARCRAALSPRAVTNAAGKPNR